MEQYLDNPIWAALNTGNSHFAAGNNSVRYFPTEITSFAGLSEFEPEVFEELGKLLPPGTVKASFAPVNTNVPKGWKLVSSLPIDQMVYDGKTLSHSAVDTGIIRLENKNVSEMQQLTRLTNPGPFFSRTIEFGNYFGVFEDGRLAAMAGQRLQPGNYSEISAVCTHPDHLGKGFAKRLLRHQLSLISAAGKHPILHVKSENSGAIALYKSLGFNFRRQFDVIVFSQEKDSVED